MVEESIRVVRDMALLLCPSMLDDLGLVPALDWQARETSKRTGIRVKVNAENVPEDLPEETKTCLYRVVQEGLHNWVQHSGACQAIVTVRVKERSLELAIRDDGKGFDRAKSRGMGLLGIQERVSHLGGTLTIGSSESGTELRVELPVAGGAARTSA
jgi:signal transduction histidine kinase